MLSNEHNVNSVHHAAANTARGIKNAKCHKLNSDVR